MKELLDWLTQRGRLGRWYYSGLDGVQRGYLRLRYPRLACFAVNASLFWLASFVFRWRWPLGNDVLKKDIVLAVLYGAGMTLLILPPWLAEARESRLIERRRR